MKTEEIVQKLENLITEIDRISQEANPSQTRLSWDKLKRWKERAIITIGQTVSKDEGNRLEGKRLTVFSMMNPFKNFKDEVDLYRSHITVLIEEIKNNPEFILGIEEKAKDNDQDSTSSPLERVKHICEAFHRVARQLRNRHDNRKTIQIEDEYDVQNLIHALLKIDFKDIRPEEWTGSYAGKSSRIDFLLKDEKVVIETKKTRPNLAEKEIGDELIIDIERYKQHNDCKMLICFIYDPEGRIGNPVGLINDLEKKSSDSLIVKVIIEPKI